MPTVGQIVDCPLASKKCPKASEIILNINVRFWFDNEDSTLFDLDDVEEKKINGVRKEYFNPVYNGFKFFPAEYFYLYTLVLDKVYQVW